MSDLRLDNAVRTLNDTPPQVALALRGRIQTGIRLLERVEPVTRECTYNLFRNRQRTELLCAVPEDHPVPGFVVAEQWSLLHPLRPLDVAPPGFNNRAAMAGVRFNRFYLFQIIAPERATTGPLGSNKELPFCRHP